MNTRFLPFVLLGLSAGAQGCLAVDDLPGVDRDAATEPVHPGDGDTDTRPVDDAGEPRDGTDSSLPAEHDAQMPADAGMPGHDSDVPTPPDPPDSGHDGEVPKPKPPAFSDYVTVLAASSGKVQAGFGPGHYRASSGDFAALGEALPDALRIPAATRVLLCAHEEAEAGADCQEYRNETREVQAFTKLDAPVLEGVAYMEVEPFVIVYEGMNYFDRFKTYGYGEYRSDRQGAAGLGTFPGSTEYVNEYPSSMFVPPGMRVRVCSDVGSATDHGFRRCLTYTDPVEDLWEIIGVSYLWVEPAVTAFAGPYGQGAHLTLAPGKYQANEGAFGPLGGDAQVGSLFVPPSLKATACSDDSGTGTCETHERTQLSFAQPLAGEISHLNVADVTEEAFVSVTIQPGTGAGAISSFPHGIGCPEGTGCFAAFQAYSVVQLRAEFDEHTSVRWEGCLRQTAKTCEVYAQASATVKVRFDSAQTCVTACEAECPRAWKAAWESCATECRQCLDF